MTKLERNSQDTEAWLWCVTVPYSKEGSEPRVALVVSSHEAQAVFTFYIQVCSYLCLTWVFHTVRFVPDSCCASTSSAARASVLSSLLCHYSLLFCCKGSLKMESFHPLPFCRAGLPVTFLPCLSSWG